jgi:hypothetical protein
MNWKTRAPSRMRKSLLMDGFFRIHKDADVGS